MAYPKAEEKLSKEPIVITSISNKILENIDILDSILTEQELYFIKMLKGGPATTKQLRDFYIFKLVSENKIQVPTFKINIPVSKIPESREIILGDDFELPSFSKRAEKELKKFGFRIPAFQTVDNMLLSLEQLGIVGRRSNPNKKGKWLWILNPNFLIALKEKKK